MIEEAVNQIAMDIMTHLTDELNNFLEYYFFTNLIDIENFNISDDSLFAFTESVIDSLNEAFYEMKYNESLPMFYYRQTYDEKFSQLMSNLQEAFHEHLAEWFQTNDQQPMVMSKRGKSSNRGGIHREQNNNNDKSSDSQNENDNNGENNPAANIAIKLLQKIIFN